MKQSRPIKRSHRGHPSNEDYQNLVARSLKLSIAKLEKLKQLETFPGVRVKVKDHQGELFPLGRTLRELFDEAVQAIEASPDSVRDEDLSRAATFLKVWYPNRGTVAEAARQLGMTRSYVSRKIRRNAIETVADQFFKMVEDISGA